MRQLPDSMYDQLCMTLTEFENATDDDSDDEWLSDGEWLDVFYQLCVEIQNQVELTERS